MELDKFWTEEIRRAIKALETRRVDPDDVERWRGFKTSLEETIKSWKVWSHAFVPCREHTKSFRITIKRVICGTHPIITGKIPPFVHSLTHTVFRY